MWTLNDPAVPGGRVPGARDGKLRDLLGIRDLYILPQDDFANGALIPCLRHATTYACMAGFFDSGAFRQLAHGLAEYMVHSAMPIRLLISPNLDEQDRRAIEEGVTTPRGVLERRLQELVGEAGVSEDALVHHTPHCLAYLLAAGRLEVKVGLVRGGLFHLKVWLFSDGDDWIVFDGSTNLTGPALSSNVEQVTVARSWEDQRQAGIVTRFRDAFERMWADEWPDLIVVDLPDAVRRHLLKHRADAAPTPDDYLAGGARRRRAGGAGARRAFRDSAGAAVSLRRLRPPGPGGRRLGSA